MSRPSLLISACLVPLGLGVLSWWMGQDSNWDLRNYHLYNAHALLHDRVGIDLAPAQLQSYFNPWLDVPYYLMASSWPPSLVGFVMGFVQGLNFVLVLLTARAVLPPDTPSRTPFQLALTGCVGAGFLAELGNTMGNNATSLFVLSGLALILCNWNTLRQGGTMACVIAIAAGGVVGLGTGLKLTNAPYLLALAGAFVVLPATPLVRIQLATTFGIGGAVGLACAAGGWWWEMWHHFGNPVFPQFNAVFDSPLAHPTSSGDTRWLPQTWIERLLWPFVFTLKPERVSDSPLPQLVWAMLYASAIAWATVSVWGRVARSNGDVLGRSPIDSQARFLLVFISSGFIAWMLVFGVYRYLIPLELLAPLALWIVLRRILPMRWFPIAIRYALIASCAVVLIGWNTWGHQPWSKKSFWVQPPPIQDADRVTVLLVGSEPMAWMVPWLPARATYASVASNFPESEDYAARVRGMVADTGSVTYAVVPAAVDRSVERIANANRWIARWRLGNAPAGCDRLRWLTSKTRWHAQVKEILADEDRGRCALEILPEARVDLRVANQAFIAQAAQQLTPYRLALAPDPCVVYEGRIGAGRYPYQWCRIVPVPAEPEA